MDKTKPEAQFYMNPLLKANCDIVKDKAIPNKWDGLFLVIGGEGVGKSTIASQLAHYMRPPGTRITIDNFVFTPKQFDDACEKLPDESVIVWDEAIQGAMSIQGAGKIAVAIIQKLTQIRKKRLKLILCFPYLHLLNNYFINRCLFMIRVYAKGFDDRGYFKFFSQPKTEWIYNSMRQKFIYNRNAAWSKTYANFKGRFNEWFPVDEAEYDKKKDEGRQQAEVQKVDINKKHLLNLISALKDKGWTSKEIGVILKVSRQHIDRLLKEFKQSQQSTPVIMELGNKVLLNDEKSMTNLDENEELNESEVE